MLMQFKDRTQGYRKSNRMHWILSRVTIGNSFSTVSGKMSQYLVLITKTNVWSSNKLSNEMHTAVSVAFSIPFSVQSKIVKNALFYSFTADPTERGGAKG